MEAEEMIALGRFDLHWVSVKVWMGKCKNREGLLMNVVEKDVPVVHVSCVEEVQRWLLEEIMVCLMPSVLRQGDGDVAEGWRKLAANARSLGLLTVSVASLENVCVECLLYNEWNVGGANSALLWVVNVMMAEVRMLDWVACGVDINSESGAHTHTHLHVA